MRTRKRRIIPGITEERLLTDAEIAQIVSNVQKNGPVSVTVTSRAADNHDSSVARMVRDFINRPMRLLPEREIPAGRAIPPFSFGTRILRTPYIGGTVTGRYSGGVPAPPPLPDPRETIIPVSHAPDGTLSVEVPGAITAEQAERLAREAADIRVGRIFLDNEEINIDSQVARDLTTQLDEELVAAVDNANTFSRVSPGATALGQSALARESVQGHTAARPEDERVSRDLARAVERDVHHVITNGVRRDNLGDRLSASFRILAGLRIQNDFGGYDEARAQGHSEERLMLDAWMRLLWPFHYARWQNIGWESIVSRLSRFLGLRQLADRAYMDPVQVDEQIARINDAIRTDMNTREGYARLMATDDPSRPLT
jgi:hypothetical protein